MGSFLEDFCSWVSKQKVSKSRGDRLIVQELAVPIRVLCLEALKGRLREGHPKADDIEQELKWRLTGFKGERAVSYYLDFLSQKDYYIFHGLRLPNGKHFFQMDVLLLTTRYILILECKNFYGTLSFDPTFNQLIRTINDKDEGFQDPISQAKWHRRQLLQFLRSHQVPLPVEYLVVISHPSTIIKTTPQNKLALNKVVHGHSLLEKIDEINERYVKEVIDAKGIRKLSKLLLKFHTPETYDVMKKFGLKEEDILTGVKCPHCQRIQMNREKGTWLCPSCGCKDKNAHISALNDYFLLIEPSITNRKFREFVHLGSDTTAKRMLGALNLPYSGENKGRIYYKPASK